MSAAHFETFRDKRGAWRWRLVAANGQVVAQSEAYTRKADAERGADDAAATADAALYMVDAGENAAEVDEERRQDEHDAEEQRGK